ncbi:LuxR family transcriptional regulator [Pontiellaceae bacterium B12219]|nr:LuxR family transcriptional regulator [Pontiellaceae bacterium B12219]
MLKVGLIDENPLHVLAITTLFKGGETCTVDVFPCAKVALETERCLDLILMNMSADQKVCANLQLLMILEGIPEVPVICYSSSAWLYRKSFTPYLSRIIQIKCADILSLLKDFIATCDPSPFTERVESDDPNFMEEQFEELFRLLTPKEHEVFCLIGKGNGSPEIAALLGCKKNTIDSHLKNIRNKLRSAGAVDLRMMASAIARTNTCKVYTRHTCHHCPDIGKSVGLCPLNTSA